MKGKNHVETTIYFVFTHTTLIYYNGGNVRKNYFLVVDTETTVSDKVADFAAVVCDKKGDIINQCAVLVDGIYSDKGSHCLFYNQGTDTLWNKNRLSERYSKYNKMIAEGSRMLASVNAINCWLEQANKHYKPVLTAYNLSFDKAKCENTNINLNQFQRSFCMFDASFEHISKRKGYKKFILKNHLFNPPTKSGNMTYKCTAETVSAFISGQILVEPHTALEDVVRHEIPILRYLLKKSSVRKLINSNVKYSWQGMQVKDNFNI